MRKNLKRGVIALAGALISGCGTIQYDSGLNMDPRQWVLYVSEKHSGWPPQVSYHNGSHGKSIDVQARTTRGAESFQQSMTDFCRKTGGIEGVGSPNRNYCFNPKGYTFLYSLYQTGGLSSPQGPSYSVSLIEIDRARADTVVNFYIKAVEFGIKLPNKASEEFKRYSAIQSSMHKQEQPMGEKGVYPLEGNAPTMKTDLSWVKVGAEVCTDLVNGIRLEGTIEQVAGDRIKVFIEDAYYRSNPSFTPGGFKQRYDWMKNTEVRECN